jgi:signal peptidase
MNLLTARATRAKPPSETRRDFHSIHPEGIWGWTWVPLLLWLAVGFYLANYRWPGLISGESNIYLAQPVMWTSVAILAYLGWRFGLEDRPRLDKRLVMTAILVGLFQIALFLIAGLVFGFGYSPYGHRILVLMGNMLFVGSMLVGVEISRAYLLAVFSQASPTVGLLVTSYLFWFLSISTSKFTSVIDVPALLRVSGETFLPVGAENLLASFLALIGGPMASIAYRGVLQAFEWLAPILPNPHWTITAFIGTMAPVIGMLMVRSQFLADPMDAEDARSQGFQSTTAWILVGVTAVSLVWFNTGLFGVLPTLVSGVSMEPALYAGDVVITRDVPAEDVEVGDIVRFRMGNSYIIHRVVEIEASGSGHYFVTKGDANNVLDDPLLESQIEGKVILTVPKIGWVSIGARRLIEWIR